MIELKNLNVGYGNGSVLEDVSMTFPSGKITVLLGPNGCGKSSLIKTTLGFLPKLAGEILYDGVEIGQLTPTQIAQHAAYMSQNRAVPSINAERMVLHGRFPYLPFPRFYRDQDRRIVHDAMEKTNTLEFTGKNVSILSGGQRQRVYLAATIAQATDTVFMDEPTNFLDVRYQLATMNMARDLAEEGKAIVIVCHDLSMGLRYADQVAVLANGSLLMCDTPEEIYASRVLEEAFEIKLNRIQTEQGWHYYYT